MNKMKINRNRTRLSAVSGLVWTLTAGLLPAETMTVSTLFTWPINPANGVHPLWTPVQHDRGRTFVVVPDVNLRPMVTQIEADGKIITVPLDPGPDYLASSDGHNRFTMGIDEDGYLHIAGDMHGYAEWAGTYVARYQYQNMMYWKSNKALDVTAGFTFAGGRDSASRLPGEEWGGDSRFFNDRHGVLYYSSRVRAFTGGQLSGSEPFIAYGVYRYDHTSGHWTALGGSAAAGAPGADRFNTVLYWEHTTSFEAYQTAPRFDARNRLHFAIAGNTANTQGQGLIYAYSDDAGRTWKKADGTPIPGLPLRGRDGDPNQGDLIIRSPKVAQQSPLCIDKDGRVAVHGDGTWRTWSGGAWTPISGGMGILGSDGMMTADGGSTLNRTPGLGQPSTNHDTGFGQVFGISELALQNTGAVYAIGLPPGTNFVHAQQMSVFKATFSPAGKQVDETRIPDAPRIFFSRGDPAHVWLSWTPVERAVTYTVKRATSKSGPYTTIAKGVTRSDEFSDTGCINGTRYCYAVSALNAAGEGPDSAAVEVMPQHAEPRPPLIQTAVGHNTRITVSWLPLWPEATSYTVKRAASAGGPYRIVARGITALTYTDSGLVNDTTYHYVVSASNAVAGGSGDESPDSTPISAAPFRWTRILHYRSIGKDDTGTASASAENAPREAAAQAFDGNPGSKWLMSASSGWLQYRFAPGESWAVTRYRLISGQDAPERDPTEWQFQGSDNGTDWVTLDAQINQSFARRNAINTYVCSNRTAYAAYRLNVTRNQGNGLTQLAELELWVDETVPATPAPGASKR